MKKRIRLVIGMVLFCDLGNHLGRWRRSRRPDVDTDFFLADDGNDVSPTINPECHCRYKNCHFRSRAITLLTVFCSSGTAAARA